MFEKAETQMMKITTKVLPTNIFSWWLVVGFHLMIFANCLLEMPENCQNLMLLDFTESVHSTLSSVIVAVLYDVNEYLFTVCIGTQMFRHRHTHALTP